MEQKLKENQKEILIVGSNGNIGNYLFNFLRDFKVTGISKSKIGNGKDFFQVDLTDLKQLKKFFTTKKRFNTVVYLVGLAHSKGKK